VTEVSYAHQSSLHLIKNTVIALLLLLQNIFREREREREREAMSLGRETDG